MDQIMFLKGQNLMTKYEQIKSHIFPRLVNVEYEKEALENTPHIRYEDLAIVPVIQLEEEQLEEEAAVNSEIATTQTYKIKVELVGLDDMVLKDRYNDKENTKGIKITTKMLMSYGVTEEQICMDALLNAYEKKPPYLSGVMVSDDLVSSLPMMILHTYQLGGAVCLFYPGTMKAVAEILKSSYYILPSSRHDLILVPFTQEPNLKLLQDMVQDVNQRVINTEQPENFLSDNVYCYLVETGTFRIAKEDEQCVKQFAVPKEGLRLQ